MRSSKLRSEGASGADGLHCGSEDYSYELLIVSRWGDIGVVKMALNDLFETVAFSEAGT